MEPDLEKNHRAAREGHAAIFLVGLLMTALIVVASLIAIEGAPIFQATVSSEPTTEAE